MPTGRMANCVIATESVVCDGRGGGGLDFDQENEILFL